MLSFFPIPLLPPLPAAAAPLCRAFALAGERVAHGAAAATLRELLALACQPKQKEQVGAGCCDWVLRRLLLLLWRRRRR